MRKPAVIGKDGRTSAIIASLERSRDVCYVPSLSTGKETDPDRFWNEVLEGCRREKPDFVVIGPEEPLAAGVVDKIQEHLKIPCVGPTRSLARLESSKSFTRDLVAR